MRPAANRISRIAPALGQISVGNVTNGIDHKKTAHLVSSETAGGLGLTLGTAMSLREPMLNARIQLGKALMPWMIQEQGGICYVCS